MYKTWKINNGYIWLIMLNLFLISPLVHSLRIDEDLSGIRDFVVIWNFACSVVVLFALQLLFKRPVIFHLIVAPFYLTVIIDLYLIVFYDARLSSGYIWILLANFHDAPGYLQDFQTPIFLGTAAFLAFYMTGLWQIRSLTLTISRSRPLALLSFSMIAFLYVGIAWRQTIRHELGSFAQGFADVLEMDLSSPIGVISQGLVVYSSIQKHRFDQRIRESFKFDVSRDPLDKPEIYVFVIGESARADRLGINGYHRDTTPNLSELDNLISYKNVITEWPLTQKAVPIMLSRATATDFDRALKEKSVIAALKEAGFETYWMTTQTFSHYAGFIHVLAGDADYVQYLNRVHDGVMLEALDEVLMQAATDNRKTFIFLHTYGSHQSYINRYPPEFTVFQDSGDGLGYREQINNAYDNSIRYTDWFLSGVIDRLKSLNAVTSLTYVSDHGENLLDDDKALLGHNFGTQYDYPIPLIFWYSDEFLNVFPEKIMNAKSNVDKKLSTSNVFYSIADTANLRFEGFLPEMSFLQNSLTERKRIVYRQNENLFFDYDEYFGTPKLSSERIETYIAAQY